jgi:hypothetical protein
MDIIFEMMRTVLNKEDGFRSGRKNNESRFRKPKMLQFQWIWNTDSIVIILLVVALEAGLSLLCQYLTRKLCL